MFCSPIVKLKSAKIPLKRLSACVAHAAKRKYTILYKKILTMAIKTFRVPVSTTVGAGIIDSKPGIERISARVGDGAVLLFVPGSTAALVSPALAVCDFDKRARTRDSIVQLHL